MPARYRPLGTQLAEVWNDTVRIRDLAIAALMSLGLGLGGFTLASLLLPRLGWGNPEQQKGYALLLGILGCLASGILSAVLFRPKRTLVTGKAPSLREALAHLGIDPGQELAALRDADPETREELRELGLLGELERWN